MARPTPWNSANADILTSLWRLDAALDTASVRRPEHCTTRVAGAPGQIMPKVAE